MHAQHLKTQNKARNIHAGFQAKMAENPHRTCVKALVFLSFLAVLLLAKPARALGVEDLQPAVRDALKTHALTKAGAPVPTFSWTLEKSRTLRKMHTVTEQFNAAKDGVAVVKVTDQRGSDAPGAPRTRMSLRALEYIDADDAELSVTVQGIDIPPKSADEFSVILKKDGQSLTKNCKVGERKAAAGLHAELPGEMAPIQCTGTGAYKGNKFKTKTQLAWFDALGVFLLLSEEADTPLGKFTETVKIKQFSK
jgi:hypothetical protein